MSDERLRELERRYKESGDLEDELRYQRELIRVNGLPFEGTWEVIESSARVRVGVVDGLVGIEAWDSNDDEKFEVSDVRWDGSLLKATFRMPSTEHTTHTELQLVGEELRGTCAGDFEGEEVWKRTEA